MIFKKCSSVGKFGEEWIQYLKRFQQDLSISDKQLESIAEVVLNPPPDPMEVLVPQIPQIIKEMQSMKVVSEKDHLSKSKIEFSI